MLSSIYMQNFIIDILLVQSTLKLTILLNKNNAALFLGLFNSDELDQASYNNSIKLYSN